MFKTFSFYFLSRRGVKSSSDFNSRLRLCLNVAVNVYLFIVHVVARSKHTGSIRMFASEIYFRLSYCSCKLICKVR